MLSRIVPALLLLAAACRAAPTPIPAPMAPTTTLVPAPPTAVGMRADLGDTLDALALAAIEARVAPAVAIAVGRHGRLVHLEGYGTLDWAPGSPPVSASTPFDLASLTKVIVTTTAAMMLEEWGYLHLDSTVAHYLPELAAHDTAKRPITVRMLLTHRGGLEAYAALYQSYRGREQYLEQIARRPLRAAPGDSTVYSDWDMILLQLVIERVSGEPLDVFAERRILAPLGLQDTGFLPTDSVRARTAATATDTTRGGLLQGVVHDGNAWAIGGVSGHAGLFGSARDLAVFAQMLLNGGHYGGVRLLRPQTIARWTAVQNGDASRALGWDTPSPPSSGGRHASPRAFGHTGFTGTSLWIYPERGLFVVLLANRVNSEGSTTGHTALRRAVAEAVHRAILDAPLVDWEPPR